MFNFDLLKACELLKCAWDMVSETTVINCFHEAGFFGSGTSPSNTDSIELD